LEIDSKINVPGSRQYHFGIIKSLSEFQTQESEVEEFEESFVVHNTDTPLTTTCGCASS
jgi:hypothetical protein